MNLGGYRKLTLQDFPGRVAAICFTVGCRLRCPYCHNPQLALNEKSVSEEKDLRESFLRYLDQRKAQLDGIVISGGEPLQQPGILKFLQAVKSIGLEVKLDTNGLYPERLLELIESGLVHYVAMDYKNSKAGLSRTIGLNRPEDTLLSKAYEKNWLKSLECLRSRQIPYELRTTVVREFHSMDTLIHMATSIRDGTTVSEPWFLQRYLESGPIMNDKTRNEVKMTAYSNEEMTMIKGALLPYAPNICIR